MMSSGLMILQSHGCALARPKCALLLPSMLERLQMPALNTVLFWHMVVTKLPPL